MKGERGFALVITLIVTALLVALSAEFINEVFVDTTLSRNFIAGQQASLLAGSGIEGGVVLLKLSLKAQNYSSLKDPWAQPLQWEDEKGAVTVTITDETGKLNLNKVIQGGSTTFSYLSVRNLMQRVEWKLPAGLLDSLVDWLDPDEIQQQNGAESSYYRSLKPSYLAKNGRLDTVEEVKLIKGFNDESGGVMRKLQPFITVYAPDDSTMSVAPVNVNTAPSQVLSSLEYGDVKMTEELARRVIEQRPFKERGEVTSKIREMQGLANYITTNSNIYRLKATAQVGETQRVIETVVRVDGDSVKTLYWREY